MKVIRLLTLTFLLAGCTSTQETISALDNMGFTNIQTADIDLFGCGQDDFIGRDFVAKNPNGKTVTGVVCSAFLKGTTVRFY